MNWHERIHLSSRVPAWGLNKLVDRLLITLPLRTSGIGHFHDLFTTFSLVDGTSEDSSERRMCSPRKGYRHHVASPRGERLRAGTAVSTSVDLQLILKFYQGFVFISVFLLRSIFYAIQHLHLRRENGLYAHPLRDCHIHLCLDFS